MLFKATNEQVAQIASNAVTAAAPVGMGVFHFKPGTIPPSRFADAVAKGEVSLDYVDGRMTKLNLRRKADGLWECREGRANPEYQSWSRAYPTFEALVESAGAEIQPAT